MRFDRGTHFQVVSKHCSKSTDFDYKRKAICMKEMVSKSEDRELNEDMVLLTTKASRNRGYK